MVGSASTAHKEDALKNLEKHVDIDEGFSALQKQGIVPANTKMSRHDKGMLVMEFGLRMMAASAQGADAMGAAGIAGQGLLESYRATKDADKKEATRVGERAQDQATHKEERAADSTDKAAERTSREGISAADNKSREAASAADNASRERIAATEAKVRMQEARQRAKEIKRPMSYTDETGKLKFVDADGNITEPHEDTIDPKTGKKVSKPGRPKQTASSTSLTPKDLQVEIQKEKEQLGKTAPSARRQGITEAQRDAALEAQARKNVMSRPGVADSGGEDPLDIGLGQ
jgi:hypothetical protein